jgi:hypothetical protein
VRCSACRKEFPVTVNASDMFNANIYPDDDILNSRIIVTLPVSNIKIILRQPTLMDEAKAIAKAGGPVKIESVVETLIIDSIEYTPNVSISAEPVVITNKEDLIVAYRSLPAKDKRTILDAYTDNFGKYGIELKMRSICVSCGNEDIVNVDLTDNFFRMVYSS